MTGDDVRDDIIQPFQIDRFRLRGRVVRLGPALDAVLARADYPPSVATALGELVALGAALAGALKFDGVLTSQTSGDGAIDLMAADCGADGTLRAFARYDGHRLAAVERWDEGGSASVPRLLGAGYLAVTVDQGPDTERYQGVVALEGATLADCAQIYFRQSEQLDAVIKIAVARAGEDWRGGAMMIQRLPTDGAEVDRETQEGGWRRAVAFMSTATASDLVDPRLAPRTLLYRLFHEDGVRAYRPSPLTFACRCSRARAHNMLRAMPGDEIAGLVVGGEIVVTCEFCSAAYRFNPARYGGDVHGGEVLNHQGGA